MAGGHSIGKIYAEVDLDFSPYTRAQKRLLKDATSTVVNIEKSYKDLGIKSAKEFDLMRVKIHNAYNRITSDAKTSAQDIVRAERAKSEQLKKINDMQFGHQTSLLSKLKKNWMAYSVAVYAIQRGLRATRTEFKEFESALVDMGKVTDQPLDQIRKDIMLINPALGDATSLVRGYYQTISAGVTEPTEALNLLTTAAKAANAAHVDQSEVIKALTKMMAGFAGQVTSAAEAADLLFSIEKLGQTSVAELVPIIGDISTASKEAGVNQYEMAAAMAQVTLTAGGTSQAATQYKAVLMGLLKPNEKLQAVIKDIGFESSVTMVKQLGFANSLQRIREEADRAGIQIGKLFLSSEGMLGLATLSVDGFEEYRRKIEEVKEGVGSAERAFASWELTAEALDKELDANFKRLMIEIGGTLAPAFNEVLRGINEAMPTFSGAIKTGTKNLAEFAQMLGLASAGAMSWWDALLGGDKALDALNKFNMGLSESAKIFKIDKDTKGWDIYKTSIEKTTTAVKKHNDTLEDTKNTLKDIAPLEKKVWEDSIKQLKEYDDAIISAHEDIYEYELELIRENLKAKEKAEKDAADKQIEEQKRALEENQKAWEHFYERVEDYTADTLYDIFDGQIKSFGDFCDEMIDLFKRTLAQMVAQGAASKIIVPIMTSVSGSLGLGSLIGVPSASASAGGTGGTGVSPGSISQLWKSMGSPGSSYLPSWLGGAPSAATGAGSAAAVSSTGGFFASGTGTGAAGVSASGVGTASAGIGIGSILGGAGLGSLGYSLLGGMLGLPQGGASGIGSALGGGIGSIFGPLGTIGGAALGGLIGSAFGPKPHKPHIRAGMKPEWEGDELSFGYAGGIDAYAWGKLRGKGNIDEPIAALNEAIITLQENLSTRVNSITGLAEMAGKKSEWLEAIQSEMAKSFDELYAGERFDWLSYHTKDIEGAVEGALTRLGDAGQSAITAALEQVFGMTIDELQAKLTATQNIIAPALDEALAAGILTGDYAVFEEVFKSTLMGSLRTAVTAAFQTNMLNELVGSYFLDVSTWDEMVSGIAGGEISIEDLISALDLIDVSMIERDFERLQDVLERLGFVSGTAAAEIEDAARAEEEATRAAEEAARAAEEAAEAARRAAEEYLNNLLDTYRKGYNELESLYANARSNYINALKKEISALTDAAREIQKTINIYDNYINSISGTREKLAVTSSMAAPDVKYEYAGAKLDEAVRGLYSSDEEIVKKSLEDIGGLSEEYLGASLDANANFEQYMADYAKTMAILDTAESVAEHHKGVAELSLTQLEYQTLNLENQLDTLEDADYKLGELNRVSSEYFAAKKALDDAYYPEYLEYDKLHLNMMEEIYRATRSVEDAIELLHEATVESLQKKEGDTASFAGGGTVTGPKSGYTLPVTFHGTEHISTDNQMEKVAKELQDVKKILELMLNTSGDINKYTQKSHDVWKRFMRDEGSLCVTVAA